MEYLDKKYLFETVCIWKSKEIFIFSLAAIRNGESTPILDAIVFKKIRALLGGSMRLMLSGGAPLSKETHDFMRVCVGAPLLQGYGLTEVAACATVMDMEDMATDQVGNPNQVKENFFLRKLLRASLMMQR